MYMFFLLGLVFCNFQREIGMYNLWDGVNYYAEVHQSKWNSIIHTLFMPATVLGTFISIPAALNLNNRDAFDLRIAAVLFYLGLYMRISPSITCVVVIWYWAALYYSPGLYYRLHTRKNRLIAGLTITISALIIQEILGHYVGGDAPSRTEGILNAVLYAPFYSVSHILMQ